jgi:hypothetical protein
VNDPEITLTESDFNDDDTNSSEEEEEMNISEEEEQYEEEDAEEDCGSEHNDPDFKDKKEIKTGFVPNRPNLSCE